MRIPWEILRLAEDLHVVLRPLSDLIAPVLLVLAFSWLGMDLLLRFRKGR